MRFLREPLLHFLVLGALVSGGFSLFDEDPRYQIDAGAAQRERLAATYLQQYGAPPTDRQLESLLDQYVRSEILFREGIALGLDQGDEIVRRRVVQKLEFVNQDSAAEPEADDAQLRKFFDEHRERYGRGPLVSFTQLYFSPDRGGEQNALQRAHLAREALRNGKPTRHLGDDPFAAGETLEAVDQARIANVFGASPLADAVFSAPLEEWAGPYRSGLGWHLVKVSLRTPFRDGQFAQVRSQVATDLRLERQQRRNEIEFRKLAAKYRVVGNRPTARDRPT